MDKQEQELRDAIVAKAASKGDKLVDDKEVIGETEHRLSPEDIKNITEVSLELTDLMEVFDIRNKEHVDSYITLTKKKMYHQLQKFYNDASAEKLAKEKLVYLYMASKAKKNPIKDNKIARELIDLIINMAQANLEQGKKHFRKFVLYLGTRESINDCIGYCKDSWLDISDDKITYTLKIMKKFYKPMMEQKATAPLTEEQKQNELAKLYFETSLTDITDHNSIIDLSEAQWEEFLVHLDEKFAKGEIDGDWEMPQIKVD